MHELIAPDRDADVARTRRRGAEEQQIAGFPFVRAHPLSDSELIPDLARQRDPESSEHVLSESAAVEALRVGAAVPVRRTAKVERRPDERVSVDR